jgi:hypothetical protein
MNMEVFLKCHTACVNQNSLRQDAGGTKVAVAIAGSVFDAIASVVQQFFPPRQESRADF